MDAAIETDAGGRIEAGRRAEALARYALDGAPEAAFDDLARLAAHLAQAPIGLVTLIDDERQWFKARWGASDVSETDLDNCICLHALADGSDSGWIGDLSDDPRTRNMWFVARGPRLRSYAGAAIRDAAGRTIGSVCVLDPETRAQVPSSLPGMLEVLARQATTLLEMRVLARRQQHQTRLAAERGRRTDVLLALGDALRDDEGPAEILAASVATLHEGLRHKRTGYAAVDAADAFCTLECEIDDDVQSLQGSYSAREWRDLLDAIDAQGVLVAEDVGTHPATRGKAAFWREAGIRRAMFCAVRVDGRLVGHYYLHEPPVDACGADDAAFLQDVAYRTQIALGKAEALRRERLNAGELNHRLKNVFAMVGAICDQTLRAMGTPREVARTLRERIVALSLAQDVLTRRGTDTTSLGTIVEAALRPFGGERIAISGPDVALGPRAATSFALAVHELATNATKYGALTGERGRVEASWSLEGRDGAAGLEFTWREHNGPEVQAPTRKGFGTRMLEGAFGRGFRIERTFEPAGAAFHLEAEAEALRA